MKSLVTKNKKFIKEWKLEVIEGLTPKGVDLLSKEWTLDYSIQIDGFRHSFTNDVFERALYGCIYIPSIKEYVSAKVNLIVDEYRNRECGENTVGTFLFNGCYDPNPDVPNNIPFLEFNFFLSDELWGNVREALFGGGDSNNKKSKISFRVNYIVKPDMSNFITEGCSAGFEISRYWIETCQDIGSGDISGNKCYQSDTSQ